MKIHPPRCIPALTFVWVLGTTLTIFAYFVWALDRGFEISDESYYVLLAMHPSSIKLMNSAQHWFTSPIWEATGSLFLFRGSGLAILLIASLILSRGVIHAYSVTAAVRKLEIKDVILIDACFLSGALLYGATINFSPCYNLISSIVAYSAVGITLQRVGRRVGSLSMACHVIVGCILGMGFLNKFPAGLAVALLVFAFILVFSMSIRTTLAESGGVAFGMLSSIAGLISLRMITEDVWDQFQFGMSVFQAVQTETGGARLLRYASEICTQMFWCGAWLAGLYALLAAFPKGNWIIGRARYFLLAVIVLACIHLPGAFTTSSWRGLSDLLATLLTITLIASLRSWTGSCRTVVLTLGLIMLPYAAGAGTGNPINTQIVIALSSWGGLMAMLALAKHQGECGCGCGFELLACGFFTSAIAVQAGLSALAPYHMSAPIWKHTVPTKIGRLGNIYTDQDTHDFVIALTGLRDKFLPERGLPYFGFYDLPGVALILDVTPVFSPWLGNQEQANSLIKRADPELLDSVVLGLKLEADGSLPAIPHHFTGFSANWTQVGAATFPYGNQTVQIWMPNKHLHR